jgi:asparagine synthase (glutamine-hydrolysing)
MMAAMKHRGPDDRGVWIKEDIHLGHNRLSIIDLSPAGHQPMLSHSGRYVIVYNGEVYNFQALRKEMLNQGVSFRSHTDTEVILALWEREGIACISRLRGMFAFAIWDQEEKTLTLVRDRLGIKPLYYAQTPGGFVFASEIKGMLASGLVAKEINDIAIALILQKGYVQQPHTILQNVHALMPGLLLRLQGQTITTEVYWKLENKDTPYNSEQEAIEAIRAQVIESVHEEMISDRPVGVFLSGGLDSTVLVSALRASGHEHINTFTIGYDTTNRSRSETDDAKVSASFYGTNHFDIQIEPDNIWRSLDSYIEAIDQPSIDGLNVWLVSQKTAEHVTVALSGLGGDELFSGYSIDRTILYRQEYKSALLNAIRLTAPIWKNTHLPKRIKRGLHAWNRFNDFTDAYLSWGEINSVQQAAILGGFEKKFQYQAVHDVFQNFDYITNQDLLQRITNMHLHTFMSGRVLTISDACAMAHSLEVRFPLIDHRLVEAAYNLPQKWRIKHVEKAAKLKNFEDGNRFEETGIKHLLYQAFKDELPKGFGSRAKKGFALPINQWMKTGLQEELRSVVYAPKSYLPQKAIQNLYIDWTNEGINWVPIWGVFIIEKWIKRYLTT